MKIFTKLFLGYFSMIVIMIAFGLITIVFILNVGKYIKTVSDQTYPESMAITNYLLGVNQIWIGTYIYIHGDKTIANQYIKNGQLMMKESKSEIKKQFPNSEFVADLNQKDRLIIDTSNHIKQRLDTLKATSGDVSNIQFELNLLQQRIDGLHLSLAGRVESSQTRTVQGLTQSIQAISQLIQLTLLGLVILTLFALIISTNLARRITTPIINFQQTVESPTLLADVSSTSQDAFLKKLNISSTDEIGGLAKAFFMLSKSLHESQQLLQNNNTNLQEAVTERTNELDQRVKELEQINKLMIGRELKMAEMKKYIAELESK